MTPEQIIEQLHELSDDIYREHLSVGESADESSNRIAQQYNAGVSRGMRAAQDMLDELIIKLQLELDTTSSE